MIIYTLIMHYYNFRGPPRISALKRTSTSQKNLLKQVKKLKIKKVKARNKIKQGNQGIKLTSRSSIKIYKNLKYKLKYKLKFCQVTLKYNVKCSQNSISKLYNSINKLSLVNYSFRSKNTLKKTVKGRHYSFLSKSILKERIKGRHQSLLVDSTLSSIQTLEFYVRHLHIFINWLHSSMMLLNGCSRGSGGREWCSSTCRGEWWEWGKGTWLIGYWSSKVGLTALILHGSGTSLRCSFTTQDATAGNERFCHWTIVDMVQKISYSSTNQHGVQYTDASTQSLHIYSPLTCAKICTLSCKRFNAESNVKHSAHEVGQHDGKQQLLDIVHDNYNSTIVLVETTPTLLHSVDSRYRLLLMMVDELPCLDVEWVCGMVVNSTCSESDKQRHCCDLNLFHQKFKKFFKIQFKN